MSFNQNLKKNLTRLESLDIIEKVKKPTDWVNSVILVKKPDTTIWTFLDPVNLNKRNKRPHQLIPSFNDIAGRCAEAEQFSRLVLEMVIGQWFWMWTQNENQKRMDEAFEGINIELIIDDVAGMAGSTKDHDEKLKEVWKGLVRKASIPIKRNATYTQKLFLALVIYCHKEAEKFLLQLLYHRCIYQIKTLKIQIKTEAIQTFYRGIPESRYKLEKILPETLINSKLKPLSDIIESGWPNNARKVPSKILPHWN
ncbi:hypothetical protein QYM36_003440 [Artemia franciscana]|uniref:Uncharacterized protein n=1 Tax=Artemia franciscana TaxID=6661 RepID=A0AA88HZS6_ARTSF|nr:hypothetical protein QYM36_003440 [Artemia franciscana]